MLEDILLALGIFAMRVLGNAITTSRLILLHREKKLIVAVLGFFESLVFVLALGAVVQHLDSILNLVAYAGGFSAGGAVGGWLEHKLMLGYVSIHIVSPEKGHQIAEAVRAAGFGATEIVGHGAGGDVLIVETVIEREDRSRCIQIIQNIDEGAFITTQNLSGTQRGHIQAIRPGLARLMHRH